MAKLLYTAETADGQRTEGFVEAPSAQAAREQLESQGLRQVTLVQSAAAPQDEAELQGLDAVQRRELAAFKLRLMQSPTLGTVLREVARRARGWLAADAALVAWGLYKGDPKWVAAGVVAAALPFAWSAWNFRHADRYQRLIRQYAVGNWDAVRVLARDLRSVSASRPELDLDLDLRLAGIYARERSLAEALERVEPWRQRLASRPGHFEMRVAGVHYMAGDTAAFVALMARAHELDPADPARLVDHAVAQARFGDVDKADALLATLDPTLLPPHGQGFVHWARGLVQLRRRQPEALATLGQAVASFLAYTAQPAVWIALALAAADQAIAMFQAGQRDAARARIAEVWPILEIHATVPLLRMLEADDLLPLRTHKNT